MQKKFSKNLHNMTLSPHPAHFSNDELTERQRSLYDIMKFCNEAGFFDSDERDIHRIIALTVEILSTEDLNTLAEVGARDNSEFTDRFKQLLNATRKTKKKLDEILIQSQE
jgi:hypothetical protein